MEIDIETMEIITALRRNTRITGRTNNEKFKGFKTEIGVGQNCVLSFLL